MGFPRQSFREQSTGKRRNNVSAEASNIDPLPNQPLPSWKLQKPQFDYHYADGISKEDNPLYLATIAKERISNQQAPNLHIYTDGSIVDDGRTGCAFEIPKLGITERFQLSAGISTFTTELFALNKACSFVRDMPNPPLNATIFTDSRSSLEALDRGGTRNRSKLQLEILSLSHQILARGTNLSFVWVPSHIGIGGNECADQAAREATRLGSPIDVGHSVLEAKGQLKRAAISNWERTLRKVCEERGWLCLGRTKSHLPHLPRRHLRILCRIRTVSSLPLVQPPMSMWGPVLPPALIQRL